MVANKVIGIFAAGLQTRGDNNPADDQASVPFDAIVGMVVAAAVARDASLFLVEEIE
jgi:hypothetical protein